MANLGGEREATLSMQLGRQSVASSRHLSGEREAALIAQGIQHAIREAISGLIKAP